MNKRLIALLLCLALVVSALPAVLLSLPAAGQTTDITVTKYASDGITILDQTTVNYSWMEANLPVQGDGTTHYWMQGPTFDPDDLWNPEETLNLKDKGAVKGTDVKDLCELVGGATSGDEIRIEADDGYGENFPYENVYAPVAAQGPMVLCWYRSGDYVPTFAEGIQLVFFAQTTNAAGQYVFGNQDMADCLPEDIWHYYYDGGILYPSVNGLSIKYIDKVSIYTGGASEWDLQLDGASSYTMSQTDFQNGLACHGAVEWNDGTDTYSGMPLWLLVGWVDDENTHGPAAFNDTLAADGYDVTIYATDGYNRTFASTDVARNDDMIIANQINGAPLLPEEYPLILVGPGLTGGQMVSMINRIELTGLPGPTPTPTPTVTPTPTPSPNDWPVTLEGAGIYTMDQTEFEGEVASYGLSFDDSGDIWEGLALWRLVAEVDDAHPDTFNDALAAAGYEIDVVAADGYQRTFTSATVARNDNMIVANTLNGAPLPPDQYPLKLVGPDVFGGNKVGQIVRIRLNGLPGWELTLDGASSYVMSQTEFEDGLGCHGPITWDDAGDVWSGMPLWLLVGWVDDADQHGPDAFNDELAAAGYNITVYAADGYNRTFTSTEVARNDNIILANLLNDEILSTDRYPLRVVGPDLPGYMKVSQLVRIELTDLPEPTPTPTAAPTPTPVPPDWPLTLTGGITDVVLQAEFEADVAQYGVSWDDEGDIWEGLALWRLAAKVDDADPETFNDELATNGYEIIVMAADSYSKTFASANVAHNENMIVANTLNGAPLPPDRYPLRLVGPELMGSEKVGQIVEIALDGVPVADGGGCFIASSAYGSYGDGSVSTLRGFRDDFLQDDPAGAEFVALYYAVSPAIADFVDDNPALKPAVRAALLPSVAVSEAATGAGLALKVTLASLALLISVALAAWIRRRRPEGQRSS